MSLKGLRKAVQDASKKRSGEKLSNPRAVKSLHLINGLEVIMETITRPAEMESAPGLYNGESFPSNKLSLEEDNTFMDTDGWVDDEPTLVSD